MTFVLQIQHHQRVETIAATTLLQRLEDYGWLPQLVREWVIDRAIAPIPCTVMELAESLGQDPDRLNLADPANRQALRQLRIAKFKAQHWQDQLPNYFERRRSQLDLVEYSLLRLPVNQGQDPEAQQAELVRELFDRIQSGADSFADIVRRYSHGSEVQRGGLVGPVEMGALHPDLAALLTLEQVGHLSEPVKIGDWWVITRLEAYKPAQFDKQTQQRLMEELFSAWIVREMQPMTWEIVDLPEGQISVPTALGQRSA